VLAANNSAVISAACHSIPAESAAAAEMSENEMSKQVLLQSRDGEVDTRRGKGHLLVEMARREVKWGVVFTGGGTKEEPGHLAFGSMDQSVNAPVEGIYYAGETDGSKGT
jgi:hypothetical protein